MGKYRDAWLLVQKQLAQTKQNRELFELIDECVLTYEDIYTEDAKSLAEVLDAMNLEFKEIEKEERTCARYELAEEEDD